MKFTDEARHQVDELRHHFRRKKRLEASRNLTLALRDAAHQITEGKGIDAPRPYPALARSGRAWVKAGRYWVAYSITRPPVILAVFYDEADMPGRA